MTIKAAIEYGFIMLKNSEIEQPKLKIMLILEKILNKNRQYIICNENAEFSIEEQNEYEKSLERLCANEPIEYIINKKEFMKLDFFVDNNVLIPRQDTEILVEEVIEICKKNSFNEILDLCTGSGAIAVSLAKYLKNEENIEKNIKIKAVDISESALEIAQKNAQNNGVEEDIEFIKSDLFKSLMLNKFNLIVSNPPYIKTAIIENLQEQVKKEPLIALDGGCDGLDFYKKIIEEGKKYLRNGGFLCLEIGFDQKDEVEQLLLDNGYKNIYSKKDLYGNDRIVVGVV